MLQQHPISSLKTFEICYTAGLVKGSLFVICACCHSRSPRHSQSCAGSTIAITMQSLPNVGNIMKININFVFNCIWFCEQVKQIWWFTYQLKQTSSDSLINCNN
jgi:hypothetical protein